MDRKAALKQVREDFTRFQRWVLEPYYELQTRRTVGKLADRLGAIGNYFPEEKIELRSAFWQVTREFIAESKYAERTQRRNTMEN